MTPSMLGVSKILKKTNGMKTEINKRSEPSLQKLSKRTCYTLACFGLEVNKMSINFMP